MFIELVDVLRCPHPHEETWLVLAAERTEGRAVMSGTIGCPICHAEFPITEGVARFDERAPVVTQSAPPDENEAIRLAALLDLTDARGYAILVGDMGNQAPRLRELTDVQLMLVNPPPGVEMAAGLSGLTTSASSQRLPLAAASARAIALPVSTTREQLESALDVVMPGGRILAPAALVIPESLTELARDERHWLAERRRAPISSRLVNIRRRE